MQLASPKTRYVVALALAGIGLISGTTCLKISADEATLAPLMAWIFDALIAQGGLECLTP